MRWGIHFIFVMVVVAAMAAPSAFAQRSGFIDKANDPGSNNPCVKRWVQEHHDVYLTLDTQPDGTAVITYTSGTTLYVRPNGAVQRADMQPDGKVVFKRICGDWPPPSTGALPSPGPTPGQSGPVTGGGGGGGGGGDDGGGDNPPGGDDSGLQPPLDPGQLTPKQQASLKCATPDELKRIKEIQDKIAADQGQLDGMEKAEAAAQDRAEQMRDQEHERIQAGGEPSTQINDQIYQAELDAFHLKQQDQPVKDSLNGEIRDLNQEMQDLLDEIGARKSCPVPDEHSSAIQDILGHVSIGVGVGVGDHHGHDDHGDHGRGSDTGASKPHD